MSSSSIFDEYYKCSFSKCKVSKKLAKEQDDHVNAKLVKMEEIKKKYSNDVMKMYKELTKLSQSYLKDMKKWDNYKEINMHNECIKNNCKVFLIHFLKKMIPVFEQQIKIFKILSESKTLSSDKIEIFKLSIKKLEITVKSIKNIDKWSDKKFDKILYEFFSVKDVRKIFSLQE